MPTVKFVNEKKEIEVPEGANLRTAAMKAGINVYNGINGFGAGINKFVNCKGWGMCGTCRVLVKNKGENCAPKTTIEKLRLSAPIPEPTVIKKDDEELRLSCCCNIEGDVEIITKPALDMWGENFFS